MTLTANVTPVAPGAGTPTGAVQFFDGSTPVGTANPTPVAGGATASITIPIAGGNFIASFAGDSNFNASSSSQKFSSFPSAVSIISTPNPAVLGQSINIAATITPQGSTTAPTGTVSFTTNGTAISGCSAVPVAGGTAVCTTSFLTKGTIPLAASYSGDSSTLASSGTGSLTVNPVATSIGLVLSPAAPVFGGPFVITASIPRSTGLPAASGQVTFIYNGQSYNVTLSSGQASLSVPSAGLSLPGPGSYVFTVTYPGDTNYTTGISSVNVTVAKGSTTTTGTAQSNRSALSVVVAPVSPSTGVPTGTVQFLTGTTVVATVPLSNGRAGLQIPNNPVVYTVVYSGDANFSASTGNVTYTLPGFNDNVTISASTNTPQANQTVTFTVNINGIATGTVSSTPAPSGTITFTDNGKVIGTANVVNGVATFTYAVPAGTHAIQASYSGDGIYLSGGAVMDITTTRANTTVNLSADVPNPVPAGQAVTITAQVTSTAQGLPAPTGTVQFLVGNTVVGTATLTNGTASFTLSNLPSVTTYVTVNYLGDYNYSPSTAMISITVAGAGTVPTTTSLTGSTTNGQTTLTATVTPVSPATGTPTGTVNFIDTVTGAVIGTATLTGGTASITVPATTDPVKAVYLGDANFAGSTSGVFPGISETNGASYALTFAPDEIAAIFGSNFAPGTVMANLPLPTTLAGPASP